METFLNGTKPKMVVDDWEELEVAIDSFAYVLWGYDLLSLQECRAFTLQTFFEMGW